VGQVGVLAAIQREELGPGERIGRKGKYGHQPRFTRRGPRKWEGGKNSVEYLSTRINKMDKIKCVKPEGLQLKAEVPPIGRANAEK